MEYAVIVYDPTNLLQVDEFHKGINKLLSAGWELYGFPMAASRSAGPLSDYMIAQAVIKKEKINGN